MKTKLIIINCFTIFSFYCYSEENTNTKNTEEKKTVKTQNNQAQKSLPIISLDSNKESKETRVQSNNSEKNPSKEEKKDEIALNFPKEDLLKNANINEISPNTTAEEIVTPRTFPLETSLGYNLDNADSNYFLKAEGKDILNASKNREINFLIKVPYYQMNDTSNTLGVVPDKFKFNFLDPFLNLYLGDNKYNLSPLTIRDLEKRGGFVNFNYKDKIGISTMYLLAKPTKDKNPSDNFGACVYVMPFSFIKLSSNFLFTRFEKEKFSIPYDNYTYSVRSTLFFDDENKLDLEAASTNKIDKKHLGYFASLDGKLEYLTYLINFVYSNPNFVGNPAEKIENTNSDRTKLDGVLKYKFKKFGAKLSHLFENYNFDKILTKEHAKRFRSSEFSISYPIFNPINTSVGVKTKELKNLINHDGYKLDAVDLDICIPIKKFSIDTTVELGKYKARMEDYFSRNWQGYKLFLRYKPTETTGLSIYTKLGNHIYDDIFTISYLGGLDFNLKAIKNLDLNLIYEYSSNTRKTNYTLVKKNPKWDSHYFKQELAYTFPNDHRISISSHLNKPLDEKKEKAFLITYTIPLELPNINRAF